MTKSDDQAEGNAGYRRVRLEDIATRCRTLLSMVSGAFGIMICDVAMTPHSGQWLTIRGAA